MSVRILIADDHEIVREGIRTLIMRSRPEWEISGEAKNGEEAIKAAKEQKPDVIILDITMPKMSGLEAASRISGLKLGTRVLMFTMHDSERLHEEARQAEAQGVVLKSQAARDLIRAIDALLAGGTFFESQPARKPASSGKTRTSSLESGLGRGGKQSARTKTRLMRLQFCRARTRRRAGRRSSFSSGGTGTNPVRVRKVQVYVLQPC
jgi:DNA-binding NarL/FixJ family response regulator